MSGTETMSDYVIEGKLEFFVSLSVQAKNFSEALAKAKTADIYDWDREGATDDRVYIEAVVNDYGNGERKTPYDIERDKKKVSP